MLHWLNYGARQQSKKNHSKIQSDADKFGLSAEDKQSLLASSPTQRTKTVKIWGQNKVAFMVFVTCQHCWIYHDMSGQCLRFDYQAATARMAPMQHVGNLSADEYEVLWQDLSFLETLAINFWNKAHQE